MCEPLELVHKQHSGGEINFITKVNVEGKYKFGS